MNAVTPTEEMERNLSDGENMIQSPALRFLTVEGKSNTGVYYEEAGQGIPIILGHTAVPMVANTPFCYAIGRDEETSA